MTPTASPQQPGHEAAKHERPYRRESGRRPEPEIHRLPTFPEMATGLFVALILIVGPTLF